MCQGLYSPKIRDNLIPVLYRMAKEENIPMTKLASRLIEEGINLERERRKHGKEGGAHD